MLRAKTPPSEGRTVLPRAPQGSGRSEPPKAARARGELRLPGYYLNRELTWLNFQHRVLHEAEDARTPLLERAKFLAIVGSNIDEFHMKRVGGLKQQVGAEVSGVTVDGRTPQQQIQECYAAVRTLSDAADEARRKLLRALHKHGVRVLSHAALKAADQAWLRDHYIDHVFPLMTPQGIDSAHPFPFVSNLSLNLLVSALEPSSASTVLSRVKLPLGNGIHRLCAVRDSTTFVLLEEVVANNLDLLFPGLPIQSCHVFRATRNAIAEQDEEQADDLLEMIESELRERKFAPVVRLEVSPGMNAALRQRLAEELEIQDAADVFEVEGMIGLRDLSELAALPLAELHDPPHRPVDHPALATNANIFNAIDAVGSVLLHHPYHSFSSSVERFLREAANDARVRAIKMTLYRTSSESQVVSHLIDAARNGKQVTVVVELKARFDEEANIRWASRLEAAGIHVTYGIVGLKTHAKMILVVRKDASGLKRYVHIGTGNYHAGTARLYSDFGLLTCEQALGRDATELFNYLTTGANPSRRFQKLLLAPYMLKQAVLARIEREAEHARAGKRALIQIKMNALEDPDLVRALYRASLVGVHIDLIVRDTCRLRPRSQDLSATVSVISIVGRFLEHARLLYFHNDGQEEYFMGSADLMTRNLESRVEVVVPIEAPELRRELRQILDIQLSDRRSAWEMEPDGSYEQRRPSTKGPRQSSQERFIALAEQREQITQNEGRSKTIKKKRRKRKAKRATRVVTSAAPQLKKVQPSEVPQAPVSELPRAEGLN
jgi:polyphosphate kinase